MASTIVEEIVGTVVKINGTGFHIAERADWVNISKYAAEGAAPMPAVGQQVKIGLDKSGYARTVAILEQSKAEPARQGDQPAPERHLAPDKDTLIIRQSSIKAAVDFLGHNEHTYGLDELLSTAASIEAWVLRQD